MLGLELPYVPEPEIETLIDQRADTLARQLEAERNRPHQHPGSGGSSGRGQVTVQFLEKQRRKKNWYAMRGEDEVCWEVWTLKVTVAEPRTEAGESSLLFLLRREVLTPPAPERAKVRRASETTLQNTLFKIITLANTHKDHIPPITTSEANPFPYLINVNPHHKVPEAGGWAARMGIY